jgi:DNA-binding transcriptional ArsR family regulator
MATASTTLASKDVGALFDALVDPVRREVVVLLGDGPRPAGDLARAFGVSPSSMSRHLRVLLDVGLVADERGLEDARMRVFRLQPERMTTLQDWLDELQASWNRQLQSFKTHVESRSQR